MSVALLISSGPIIAANIPAIAQDFPATSLTQVGFLTTIPSLFVILGVLIANLLELRIGKKRTILTGLGLVFIAGIFPALKHDIFSLLFASRCLFGLGIGLFNRLIIQMISDIYHNSPSKQASVIGLESAFEGLGGICLTLFVGQLLKINWYTSFYVYALALPIFAAFLFFVPADKRGLRKGGAEQLTTTSDYPSNNRSLRVMIGFGILLFVIVTIFINYNIQITPLIMEKNIGNATNGSNMIAFIGLGAFIAGFSFGKLYKYLRHYIVPLAILLLGVAMFVTTISQSIILTTFCSMVIGFSFRCIMPYLLHTFTQQIAKMAKLGTTIVLVAYNLGATLSPYEGTLIRQLFHVDSIQSLVSTNAMILLLIAITGFGVAYVKNIKEKAGEPFNV
ncbi:MFS transporter [Paenibacillus sp. FSL R7-0331]|uniref:MFS transporter n=1 Tax=Paenibacillus sp. FSL R7-0331 TaxID=1536773 RepID=UPI000694B090|nr:MFS transporter [Paenibacillus sp. FSL R7-0331]